MKVHNFTHNLDPIPSQYTIAKMSTEEYVEKIEKLSTRAQAWAELPRQEKAAMLRSCAANVSADALSTRRMAADIAKVQKLEGTEGEEFEALLQALVLFGAFPMRFVPLYSSSCCFCWHLCLHKKTESSLPA